MATSTLIATRPPLSTVKTQKARFAGWSIMCAILTVPTSRLKILHYRQWSLLHQWLHLKAWTLCLPSSFKPAKAIFHSMLALSIYSARFEGCSISAVRTIPYLPIWSQCILQHIPVGFLKNYLKSQRPTRTNTRCVYANKYVL